MTAVRLMGFGRFFGNVTHRVDASGVSVQELVSRPPPNGVPRHTHEHAHACFVVSGRFEVSTGHHRGECPPATLLYHPAGTTHEDQLLSRRGCCVMVSLEPDVLAACDPPRLADRFAAIPDTEIGLLGYRLRVELREPDALSDAAIEWLVLEIATHVARRTERPDTARPRWVSGAIELIRARGTEGVRVGDVADAVGVHPVHLARVFRRRFGLSPVEYLRRVRVQAALQRIERTREPLSWIAMAAGFCDQSEMTNAFRRELGCTPGSYRRAIRN